MSKVYDKVWYVEGGEVKHKPILGFKFEFGNNIMIQINEGSWISNLLIGTDYFLTKEEAIEKLNHPKLSELLLKRTDIGDIVLINDSGGWQIGCTMIDAEDLFMRSLNPNILEEKVKEYEYVEKDWTSRKVMEVWLA